MSSRRAAALDGSLLARKGDAAPAVPCGPAEIAAAPGGTSPSAQPPDDGRQGQPGRFGAQTTSRRGLAVLVAAAGLTAAAIAAERAWGPADRVAVVPEAPAVAGAPVADAVASRGPTLQPAEAPTPQLPSSPASAPVTVAAPAEPAVAPQETADPPPQPRLVAAVLPDEPPPRPPAKPEPVRTSAAVAPPSPAAGPYILQLAAFSDPGVARREAMRLQKRLDAVLGERKVAVLAAAPAGRQPVYRLRTDGYATLDAARDACHRIRALKTGCIVIRR